MKLSNDTVIISIVGLLLDLLIVLTVTESYSKSNKGRLNIIKLWFNYTLTI